MCSSFTAVNEGIAVSHALSHVSKFLVGAALVASAVSAYAQGAYPNRPVRLVVSQAAGGSSDTIARLWAEHAGKALGGTIVVENVFYLPGLGRLIFQSISNRDLIVVRNCVMLLAAMVIVVNFVVDVLYAAIDPRVKASDL